LLKKLIVSSNVKEVAMNTLAIAVAGLGSGLPDGAVHVTTLFGVAPSTADVVAGLGALALATLGVLVVRYLQPPSDLPEAPEVSLSHKRDHFDRAA